MPPNDKSFARISPAARLAIGAAFAVISFCGPANAAPARTWTVIELTSDALGGSARDVNNRGDVIGQTYTSEGGLFVSHAYLWQNGLRTDIGSAAGRDSVPWAINDKGTIVGNVDGFAYLWKDGQATSLGFAGEGTRINKSEEIIGRYWTGGAYGVGQDRAVLYRDGVLTELGTLGGVFSIAGDINDRGVIVGSSYLPRSSTSRAFIWEAGVMRELPGLGGTESFAGRIDEHGDILGVAFDAAGKQWMVRWTSSDAPPQKLLERVSATMNRHGDIAGNNLDTGKPFLLERDGTLTWLLDLPPMQAGGWHSFGVSAMNDRGWIVGSAWKPGVSTLGTALLLIPR